jgi:hypothetical protein
MPQARGLCPLGSGEEDSKTGRGKPPRVRNDVRQTELIRLTFGPVEIRDYGGGVNTEVVATTPHPSLVWSQPGATRVREVQAVHCDALGPVRAITTLTPPACRISSSCGSGRGSVWSCSLSNRMDSRCESSTGRVLQQRPAGGQLPQLQDKYVDCMQ